MRSFRSPFVTARLAAALVPLALVASVARGQAEPRRLELADSATRRAPAAARSNVSSPAARRVQPADAPPRSASTLNAAFVRNQTLLGAFVYGPSFATAIADNPVGWAAGYLVVAGGSFFAAAELSRDVTITEPMQHLATGAAIRGAIAGAALARTFDASARSSAGAIFLGSVTGTSMAIAGGRGLSDGQSAATLFGADAGGLAALATATVAGPRPDGTNRSDRTNAASAVGGMVAGAMLGKAWASSASYGVTAGDVSTLWATSGIGAMAGWTVIADRHPDARSRAAALASGGLLGIIAGDRLLVRRFDHSRTDGDLVQAGAVAGGLMGAGIAVLTGASHERFSAAMSAATAAGAIGGVVLAERFAGTQADAGRRLGALEVNPAGVIGVASGRPGTYPLLRWTF